MSSSLSKFLSLFKPYKLDFAVFALFLLLSNCAQLSLPKLMQWALELLQGPKDLKTMSHYAMTALGLMGAMVVLKAGWRYFLNKINIDIEEMLKNTLMTRGIYAHLHQVDQAFVGRSISLINNDVKAVFEAGFMGLLSLLDALFMVAIGCYYMGTIHPGLTVVVLLSFPVTTWFLMQTDANIYETWDRFQQENDKLTEYCRERVSQFKTVKLFSSLSSELYSLAQPLDKLEQAQLDFAKEDVVHHPLFTLTFELLTWLLICWGGWSLILGEMTFGGFVAFYSYLAILEWPFVALAWSLNLLQRGLQSTERWDQHRPLEEVLDAESELSSESIFPVHLERVSLAYKGSEPVVAGVTQEVNRGDFIGLVGRIGSGKSTFLQGLSGLKELAGGNIRLNGFDAAGIAIPTYRSNILYVPQEPFVFSGTIWDNLILGLDDIESDEVIEACRVAGIWQEIESFPSGLNTIVGEQGITLSGGQRQRLTIARALLRPFQMLLLDDSLSAVDQEKELAITHRLKAFLKDERAVILVSQRESILHRVDRIWLLENHELSEVNSNDQRLHQLFQKKELYEP